MAELNIRESLTLTRELSFKKQDEKKADPKPRGLKDLLRKVYGIMIIFLPFVTKVS